LYDKLSVFERHRHRYEVNKKYKNDLEKKGFIFSGYNPENKLSEIIEYNKHPFYIGVQFHPEFNSNPLKEHPLFKNFIKIVIKNKEQKK
jgi:CTP synthase